MNRTALEWTKLVIEKMNQEDYAAMKALARDAVSAFPDHVFLRSLLGYAHLDLNETDLAEAAFRVASKREENPTSLTGLGSSLLELGRIEEAEVAFTKAASLRPTAYRFVFLGLAQRRLGKTDAAIASFEKALRLDPDDDEAMFNLAVTILPDDSAQAEKLLRRAIEIDPDYALWRQELGNALLAQSRWEEAEIEIRKSLDLDPESYWSPLYLAAALDALERFDEEEEILLRFIKKRPKDGLAKLMLGNMHFACGELDLARRAYLNAFRLDDRYAQAAYKLARVHCEMNRLGEAREWLERANQIDPNLEDKYGLLLKLNESSPHARNDNSDSQP